MEDVKTTYKFSIITCLMSLDKNNENYENKKNKILELLKQVEDIKTKKQYAMKKLILEYISKEKILYLK